MHSLSFKAQTNDGISTANKSFQTITVEEERERERANKVNKSKLETFIVFPPIGQDIMCLKIDTTGNLNWNES